MNKFLLYSIITFLLIGLLSVSIFILPSEYKSQLKETGSSFISIFSNKMIVDSSDKIIFTELTSNSFKASQGGTDLIVSLKVKNPAGTEMPIGSLSDYKFHKWDSELGFEFGHSFKLPNTKFQATYSFECSDDLINVGDIIYCGAMKIDTSTLNKQVALDTKIVSEPLTKDQTKVVYWETKKETASKNIQSVVVTKPASLDIKAGDLILLDPSITLTQTASTGNSEQIFDNGTLSSTNFTTMNPITNPIGEAQQLFRYTGDLNEPNALLTNVTNEGMISAFGGYLGNAVSNSSCGAPNMGSGLCGGRGVVNYQNFRTDDTPNMTISAWVNYQHTGTGYNSKTVIAKFVGAGGWSLGFYENGGVTNPLIYFQYLNASGSYQATIPSGTNIASNKWFHVVLVAKSVNETATSLEYYINGTLKKQENITLVSWNLSSTAAGITVGGRDTSTSGLFFNGTLDNVLLLRGALNSSQVMDVYTGNMTRYNSTRASSYVPLIGLNATDYINITYPNVFIPYNSSYNAINFSVATWNVSNGYTNATIDSSLIRYFRFDKTNSNPNQDFSATSANLTCTNCPTNSTGILGFGEAYTFDGTNDILNGGTITFPASATYSVWFKTNKLNTSQIIYSSETAAYLAGLQLRADGKLTWAVEETGTKKRYWRIEFQYEKEKWYHTVVTQTSADATPNVYINGVLQSTTLVNTAGTPSHIAGTFYVGGYGTYNEQYVNGTIDELKIFNRVLNLTEIEQLYFRDPYWNWTKTQEFVSYYNNETRRLDANDLNISGFKGGLVSQERIPYSFDYKYAPYMKNEYNLTAWTSTEPPASSGVKIDWLYPTSNINVTQNQFFNVSVNVSCYGANCNGINVSLDPISGECDPENGEGSQCSQLFVPSTADPYTYSAGGYAGFCIFSTDKTVYKAPSDEYGAFVDVDCDSYLPAGTGDCAFINDVGVTGDGMVCPSYARKGSAVASGDCVEVDCMGGGSITASSWFNLNNEFFTGQPPAKGLINTTAGATPFYTNGTNPTNITLNNGESRVVTWYVNATGDLLSNHTFFAYANLTSTPAINNITARWNVTITAPVVTDNEYPQFTNLVSNFANNSPYVLNRLYVFNATITSTNASAGLEFNGVNYSVSNISSVFNSTSITGLGAGTYSYYWWAYGNGTNTNYNTTSLQSYTIDKATQTITPLLNGLNENLTITYPQQFNASYSGTNYSDVRIYINGTQLIKAQNYTYGVGTYNLSWIADINQNYTGFNGQLNLTINKAESQTGLTFDSSSPQTYPTAITPTCSIITGETNAVLTINTTIATSGNPITLGAGIWNITCTQEASQNYTRSFNQSDFTINQAYNPLSLTSSAGWTLTYPTSTTLEGFGNGTIKLFKDDIEITNPTTATYGVGIYTIIANTTGNQNYTANITQQTLTINQGTPTGSLLLNNTDGNISIFYNSKVNASFTNSTYALLYRNDVEITNLNNIFQDLAVGYYNFTLIIPNSQNYTSLAITRFANITQATTSLSLTGTSPITYGTTGDVEGTNCPTQNTCNLYRDGVLVSNPDTSVLSAGVYSYVYNTSATQNYTSDSETFTLTINKANGVVYSWVNNTRANITIKNDTSIWLNATLQTGQFGNLNLSINDVQINYSSSNIANYYYFANGGGVYRVKANYSGNTNYTSDEEQWNITVTTEDITSPIWTSLTNKTCIVNQTCTHQVIATDSSGIANYTLNQTNVFNINNSGYIFNVTAMENITIYYLNISVNDTLGNLLSGIIWINVTDTAAPTIRIIVPDNNSVHSSPITLTITSSVTTSSCWRTVNNGKTNTTFTYPSDTISGLLYQNYYNITAYCNGTTNKIGSDEITIYYTVGMTSEEKLSWIYLIIFGLACLFLVVGYFKQELIFVFSSGILFLIGGIYLTINGFPGITNVLLYRGVGVTLIGIGMYLSFAGFFEFVPNFFSIVGLTEEEDD